MPSTDNADLTLDGIVVSVLTTGPKVRGFNPTKDDGFLKVTKNQSQDFLVSGIKAVGPI
jgi:hypothetical protein